MKILVISHEYPPIGGGGANACFFLTRELKKYDNQVTLVTAQYADLPLEETTQDGVLVYRVQCKRANKEKSSFSEMFSYLCSAWQKTEKLLKVEKFDKCLVFFGIPSGPLALHLKHRYKLPYVVRLGGGDIPGAQKRFKYLYMVLAPIVRRIWREADALIANSEGLKKRAYGFESQYPVTVVENGVDNQFFIPLVKKDNNGSCIKILFVSRLIEGKGLQYLIPHLREIESAVKEKCNQLITLTIVGDGPYRTELEELTQETGTQRLVSFVGRKNKEEVRQYYQEADIFVLPSLSEGMPNVVLEAMACGLPIIMTPCEGSKELVTDNGIITSLEDLSDNLVKLCTDSSLRASMGQKSVWNVERSFRWESIGKKYLEILG
ncbi:MAG: glycosyltransferase family 4 protein [Lachnospiraceae bacterium]|nr:glycosyltransferase family 4 protein [Lachnospiraceae bacterium]